MQQPIGGSLRRLARDTGGRVSVDGADFSGDARVSFGRVGIPGGRVSVDSADISSDTQVSFDRASSPAER